MTFEFEAERLDRMIRMVEQAQSAGGVSWQQVTDILRRAKVGVEMAGRCVDKADEIRKAA